MKKRIATKKLIERARLADEEYEKALCNHGHESTEEEKAFIELEEIWVELEIRRAVRRNTTSRRRAVRILLQQRVEEFIIFNREDGINCPKCGAFFDVMEKKGRA